VFFHEVLALCDAEDNVLTKLDCYKSVNLIPLRKSALRALAACHYIGKHNDIFFVLASICNILFPEQATIREKIFKVLYRSLEKNNPELQEAAFECMQKFIQGYKIDKETVHSSVRPLLMNLGDCRNLSVSVVKRLSYLTKLFPTIFNEKLCEQLLTIIKIMLENSIAANKDSNFLSVSKTGENEQIISILIGIFHQIPAATHKFIEALCRLVLQTEKTLMVSYENNSDKSSVILLFLISD
jgi:transformation/transcription domain-associated protein